MQQTVLISMEMEDLKSMITDSVNACLRYHQLNAPNTEEILGVDEVCSKLGVSRTTVYQWRRSGKVPSHQIGRRVFFKKSELLKFSPDQSEGQKKEGKI